MRDSQFKRDDAHRPYVAFLTVQLVTRDLRRCNRTVTLTRTLSLRFNGLFPGEPG